MTRQIKIVGNEASGYEVIEYDPYTGQVYGVYPCGDDIKLCREIYDDLRHPEYVNAKLLMLNYHIFDRDPVKAKKKIIEWLKWKVFEACELERRVECKFWMKIWQAFRILFR